MILYIYRLLARVSFVKRLKRRKECRRSSSTRWLCMSTRRHRKWKGNTMARVWPWKRCLGEAGSLYTKLQRRGPMTDRGRRRTRHRLRWGRPRRDRKSRPSWTKLILISWAIGQRRSFQRIEKVSIHPSLHQWTGKRPVVLNHHQEHHEEPADSQAERTWSRKAKQKLQSRGFQWWK